MKQIRIVSQDRGRFVFSIHGSSREGYRRLPKGSKAMSQLSNEVKSVPGNGWASARALMFED